MNRLALLIAAIFTVSSLAMAEDLEWHFTLSDGHADKLVWQTREGFSYDLWHAGDLGMGFSRVEGFPRDGTGGCMEHRITPGMQGFFRIHVAPHEFVRIQAGSFVMGNDEYDSVAYVDEWPEHSVHVSTFLMARHEVTFDLWRKVRRQARGRGYGDLPEGDGQGAEHPVHSVNWYAMVKWCNARSEIERLEPCYSVDGEVYRNGESDAVVCDWSANGYRLPCEAEWEKAARGGWDGMLFPWGADTITHSQANYRSTDNDRYDVSPSRGYHPGYDNGLAPHTSPVGSFAPNRYGLYDMAGNVWEQCWDWRWRYPSEPQTDPRGAEAGSFRMIRGGGWGGSATGTRCPARFWRPPGTGNSHDGFRLARSVPSAP